MSRWLDAAEAADRLGVKPATLYAYVSRGQLRRRDGPDGRRSQYHPDDVASLAVRGRRARPVRPSDIVVPTAITAITPVGPTYRGLAATELAGRVGFEQVAEHLWGVATLPPGIGDAGRWRAQAPVAHWEVPAPLAPLIRTAAGDLDDAAGPAARLPALIGTARLADVLRDDLRPSAVTAAARGLIAALAWAGVSGAAEGNSVAGRIVATLFAHPAGSDPVRSVRGAAAHHASTADVVDAALVLLADHELAASTVAARVAASSRCDPYAVVLAGAAVHTGHRHGAASRPMERAVREVAEGREPAEALAGELTVKGSVPGFGHPLYPDGDPRGTRLLEILEASRFDERSAPTRRLLKIAAQRGLDPPNIDAALAGLTYAIGAPVGSGEFIFAIARTAGWIAHALEQYEEPRLLRPRAVYTGP